MRIIGGKWKGKTLADIGQGDASAHLRPSSDRTRETLFNILRPPKYDLENARVLDLFAGTGALGLEALSRGAQSACFVENGETSLRLLAKNIQSLRANADVVRADATKGFSAQGAPFDFVFLDPPYAKQLGERAVERLIANAQLEAGAYVIWEEEKPPLAPYELRLLDQRKIGRALLSIYRFEGHNG